MGEKEDIETYKKALKREKSARKQAEKILEEKAQELFQANSQLKQLNQQLEQNLEERLEELKEKDMLFEEVIAQAQDIFYRADLRGYFTYVNKIAVEITGYTEEELIGKHYSELIVSPEYEEIAWHYSEQIRKRTFSTYLEYQIQTKTGKKIWLGQKVQLIVKGKSVLGFSAFARDITERVNAYFLLRSSEEKYRSLLENMQLGIIEVDLEDSITKVYDSFCELTGYSKSELLGRKPKEFLLDEESLEMLEEQNRLRTQGQSSVYEVKIRKKNGEVAWVLISGAPFTDISGRVRGSIGIHLDITGRKQLELDLEKALDDAEANFKAKELFLANMSHEIRTPLNAVIGMSQLLEKTYLDNEQHNYTEVIRKSSKNLLALVNNVLDFSKMSAGEVKLDFETAYMNEIIHDLKQTFMYQAQIKDLDFIVDHNFTDDDFFMIDKLRLTQVLTNLINNAFKFTNEGYVKLKIQNESVDSNIEEILFEVSDTGKGISKEGQQEIFQEFKQDKEKGATNHGGTGLGLSISSKIVNLFGSELRVKSTLGEGSNFYFKLIVDRAGKDDFMDENASNLSLDWRNVHILLAEDNIVNQFLAKSLIEAWGAKITVCSNGVEVIERLEQREFDIILMDIQMPVMNGIAATEKIRTELNLDIPIIALTANAIKGDDEKFMGFGMNDYLSKPFEENDLKTTITKNLVGRVKPKTEEQMNGIVSPDAANNDVPLFQIERLNAITNGNQEMNSGLLKLFISESQSQIPQLESIKDPETVSKLAHKIKPSIDHISNEEMSGMIREIESMKEELNEQIIQTFIDNWKTLLQEIEQYLNSPD